ncbi:eukaryotic translation initiation factor 5B-like [Tropilaelaps mercedesae]|uniref:Eukaryotic translation initiation factor 5B n=1 Tax=Tropilaelaps mercedesae TaxID=418985 RepID=A0A1V9XG28_9ACAR|nr:eukaryotic translation initiation factor 5B-like [Tropilaelaps mercedesae]
MAIVAPKAKAKNKTKGGFAALAVDDDTDEVDDMDMTFLKPKSGFAALMDDGGGDDDHEEIEEPAELRCKTEKRNKKKEKLIAPFYSDDDDAKPEDHLSSDNGKATKKEKKAKEKKGKKGKKDTVADENAVGEEDLDKLLADMNIEINEDAAKKDKKKKKKNKKEADGADQRDAATGTGNQPNQGNVMEKQADASAEQDGMDTFATPADMESTTGAADDKKKKKKKKKKDEKESTPMMGVNDAGEAKDTPEDEDDKKKKDLKGAKGKKPGKAALAQMQEALRKMKEEEERMKADAEEKARLEEEAERLRVKKLQEERERKELKKQRDKEKKDRLKAEGKLLTKAQKQAQARAQATLEALRAQGINVPNVGEKLEGVKPSRAPIGRRNKDKKPSKTNTPQPTIPQATTDEAKEPEAVQVEIKDATPSTETESGATDEKKVGDSEDDVREAWDASSESEDETGEQAMTLPSGGDVKDGNKAVVFTKAAQKATGKTALTKRAEASSEEDEDEDDSEDKSTEEGSSEEEEESTEEERCSEDDVEDRKEKLRQKVLDRIRKRQEINEKNRTTENLRSPVICVLGHVDTGKTKILDYIRRTHVQDNEAGGITQQIGATQVPLEAIQEQCKAVKDFANKPLRIPGALIIDTPGHESFSNLRSRGSSLCDMAILVVDIMHGLQLQTIESVNLLKNKKTPFVVALNKIDRLYDWKGNKHKDVIDVIKRQSSNTKLQFDDRARHVITQFAEQGLNAALFYENPDPKSFISLVPTSAFSGDGMGNLISLVVELTQKMLAPRIAYSEELQATVLEVKAIPGLGTTIDVIVVNGELKEGDTMVLAGHEGPLVTPIRSLLMPQPLKELRVKNAYQEFKRVKGAQGVKIAAKDLDKAIAGLNVLVAHHPDEIDILKEEIARSLKEVMSGFKLQEQGVYVQASTLGSLEALLVFLRDSKIPYSGIRIGPVVKKDVMKASVMLEHDSQYAVILAFDVKTDRDAQELADHVGVKIFSADIIYHLFDKFTAYRDELRAKKREEFKNIAVFPCKLRVLPNCIFNKRDPIIVGVMVEAGIVKLGSPLCVPSKENLFIGTVSSIEINHKQQETARKGEEVCIRIENTTGDAPKLYGRHFDNTDLLVSKISRESIDACKNHFRADLSKQDWQLMVELKKVFEIL